MTRTLPPAKFNPKLTPKPNTAAGTLMHVPIDDIRVLKNFNLRVDLNGIAELADSIASNGYLGEKPLAGYATADDKIIVIDGHRRLAAVKALNDASLDGPVITTLPVIVKPETASLSDLTIAMMQSASGEPLTPFEKGVGVRRLLNDGMTKEDIAIRLGVTEQTIANLVFVASATKPVINLLLDDKVTYSQILLAKGDEAKLRKMVDTAAAKGRKRARPSDDAEIRTKTSKKPDTAGLVPDKIKAVVGTVDGVLAPVTPVAVDFTVPVVREASMGAVLKQLAGHIRATVPHDRGDSDAAHVAGSITVSISLDEAVPDELAHTLMDL